MKSLNKLTLKRQKSNLSFLKQLLVDKSKHIKFAFSLFLIFVFSQLQSQTSILYTDTNGDPLEIENIVTCQDSSFANQMRIVILEDIDNLHLTITLPDGVSYVPTSIKMVANSGSLSISENDISGPSSYSFDIFPANLSTGDYITVEWGRKASCDAMDNVLNGDFLKDLIYLTYDSGTDEETDNSLRSYDLLSPSLSIQGEGQIITDLGESITREITLTNGGLGDLDEFSFYIVDGNSTSTSSLVTPNGTEIIPSGISNDTLFYSISNIISEYGNNDAHFGNGEQLVFIRNYSITACGDNSYYKAYWGCDGTSCQGTNVLEQVTVLSNNIPNIVVTMPNPNPDYCFNGDNAAGGAPILQTFEVKNTGNGPATNFDLTLRSWIAGSSTGYNYFSDDLWIVKDAQGDILGTMDNLIILNTTWNTGSDCVAANTITHLRQSATGITIPAGESVFIEVPTYVPNLECNNSCRKWNRSWYSFSGEWSYKDQCENNNYGVTDQRFDNRAHNFQQYTIGMPTDLVDQQEFEVEFFYSRLYSRSKSTNDGSTYLIVSLENADLIYNGPPTITAPWGGQLPVTVVGDDIRIKIQNNLSGRSGIIPIKLQAICGNGGTQSIGFSHEVRYDNACGGDGHFQFCQDVSFVMHCPTPCPRGGATPLKFALERLTHGLPDYNENHLPDNNGPIVMDSIKRHRGVNGDTVLGTWNIKVHPNTVGPNAGIPFNHTYVEFDLRDHPSIACDNPGESDYTTVFTALPDAEIIVYPADGGAQIICSTSPIIDGVTAKYDLGDCQALWTGGDSIVVRAKFIANASIMKQGFTHYVANNQVYSSYIENPAGNNPSDENKYTCDHFNDYFILLNIYNSAYMPANQDINGCENQFRIVNRQYINKQSSAVWFPNEYRSFSIQDEYIVDWPAELVYRPGSANFSGKPIPDSDVSQVGNTLIFSNLRQFYTPYGGSFIPRDEVEVKSVYWSIDPSCDAEPGSIYHAKFYEKQLGNGINTPTSGWDSYIGCWGKTSANISMLYDKALPFITGGGTQYVTTDEVEWQIYLNNGSNNIDAPNSWFYLDDVYGNLTDIVLKQNETVILPDANGMYKLGTNPINSTTPYTISAKTNSCSDAEITLVSGFHCSSYPNDPNGCSDENSLKVKTLPSEVQLSFLEQAVVPMSLCEDQPLKIRISSAQSAYLDESILTIFVPDGVIMPNTINIEYPEGSGNIEAIVPTINGNNYSLNLELHSQMSEKGIPGTVDALAPANRSVIVGFDFDTNCDFLSGDNFTFQINAQSPCGEPVINNGIRARSVDLYVSGVDLPYATIQTEPLNTLDGCDNKTIQAGFEFVSLNASTTSPSDTAYIILEEGLEYIPGSFICTSPNCLIFDRQFTDNIGNTVVVLRYPPEGFDLYSGSATTTFDYQVKAADNTSCGDVKNLIYRAITTVGNVPCSSEAGLYCPSLDVTTGQVSTDIKIRKTIANFQSNSSFCYNDGSATYNGSVSIDSVGVETGDTLFIDVYCADTNGNATNFLESLPLAGPIEAGTIVPFSGDLSELCSPENGAVLKINSITNNNTPQCICNDNTLFIEGTEKMVITIVADTIEICEGESTDISVTAIGGNGGFVYTWDNDLGSGSSKTVTPESNTEYNVLVTDSKGCFLEAKVLVIVNQQPTVGVTGPSTICEGETTSFVPVDGGTWISNNPEVATITNAGVVTGVGGGTASFVFTSNLGCSEPSNTSIIVVGSTDLSLSGPDVLCIGDNTTLLPNSGGIWSSNDENIATVSFNGVVSAVSSGTAIFSYTELTNGCTSLENIEIIINEDPEVEIVSGNETCIGETGTLSPSSGGIWTSSNDAIATVRNDGVFTGISAGAVSFTFTPNIGGCSSNPTSPVTILSKPTISLNGLSEICIASTTNFNPSSGGEWTSSDNSIATITNTGLVTGISAGTVSFTFVSSSTSCSSEESQPITILPIPEIVLTGASEICVGETTSLSPSSGGTWTSSNNSIATITNDGIVTGVAAGVASFSYTNSTNCSSTETIEITINPKPVVRFTGSSSICIGSTTTVSANTIGVWTSSDEAIATIDNNGNIEGITGGTVYFSFVADDSACSSDLSTPLTVYSAPIIENSGPDDICIGTTTVLLPTSGGIWISSNSSIASITNSGLVTGVIAGEVSFSYVETSTGCSSVDDITMIIMADSLVSITGPNELCVEETSSLSPNTGGVWTSNDTDVATVTANGIVTAISQGVVRFTFISEGGCTSPETNPMVVYNKPTTLLTGPSLICIGSSTTLTPNTGGTWTSSDENIATITSDGIVTAMGLGSVSFIFTNTTTGCDSEDSEIVTVTNGPAINLLGSSEICIGGTTHLAPTTGGVWTSSNPSIASIENNGLITGITPGFVTFTFVDGTTGCDTEYLAGVTVLEDVTPIYTGPTSLCVGETTTITPNSGGTWTSSDENVATITNDGVITAINQGLVQFSYTNNTTNCSTGLSESLLINAAPSIGFTGPDAICIGSTTYLFPTTGGTWTSSDENIATVTDAGEVTGVNSGTASFTFTSTTSNCDSDNSLSVTVENGTAISITGETDICIGYSTTLSTSGSGLWESSNPNIASITIDGVVTGLAPGVVTFQFTDSENGCSAASSSAPITVSPCLNPDFNVTLVDMPINGNINTNDNVPAGSTYNNFQVLLTSKPEASSPNITINVDGTYEFVGNVPGKYIYEVEVCIPPMEAGCPRTILEITVLDDIYADNNPVANLEFTTTFMETSVILDCFVNDQCVNTAGCSLDATNMSIVSGPNNGSVSIDPTGKTTYTPNAGYIGFDTIFYQNCEINNPTNCSVSQQIITINDPSAINSTVASDEFVYTMKETAVSGEAMINDSDAEENAMSVVAQGTAGNPIIIPEGSYFIDSNGNYTFTPADGFTGAVELIYSVCDDNIESSCTNATIHILVFPDLELFIKVYLEGSLMLNDRETSSVTGRPLMRDGLRNSVYDGKNYIPLQDPYSHFSGFPSPNITSKYTHVGAGDLPQNKIITDSLAVFSVEGDNAIVDWVFVELRHKDDKTLAIATRSGLVQRDGDVVDLDGVSPLSFGGVNQDSFYVMIKHRSHLGTMTMLVPNDEIVDFTDPNTELFNFGLVTLTGLDYTGLSQNTLYGYNALWAGDFDSNGRVKLTNPNDDYNIIAGEVKFDSSNPEGNANFNYGLGYRQADYNMDAKVKFTNPGYDDTNFLFSQIIRYDLNLSSFANFSGFIEQIPK